MAVALFHFISLVQVFQSRLCDVDTSNSEGKSRRSNEIFGMAHVRCLFVLHNVVWNNPVSQFVHLQYLLMIQK